MVARLFPAARRLIDPAVGADSNSMTIDPPHVTD